MLSDDVSKEISYEFIKNKDYDKALLSLEIALDEDKETNKLYEIVDAYQNAKKAMEKSNIYYIYFLVI